MLLMAAALCARVHASGLHHERLPAAALSADGIAFTVHLPDGYDPARAVGYPVLYVNDGQDRDAVRLDATTRALVASGRIVPLIVVSIDMPPDRMAAYGLSDRARGASAPGDSRAGPVGTRAHAYAEWIAQVLVPHIDRTYRTQDGPSGRTLLGWSLGGLQAFNMGWRYPDRFGCIGAFSPSLWLPADRSSQQAAGRTRIAHRWVDADAPPAGVRWWLSVGTHEETDDRDGDGINDALDDVMELALGGDAEGVAAMPLRGLAQHRLSIAVDPAVPSSADADVVVWRLQDGRHTQEDWARMLPAFLSWAFATGRQDPPR